MLINVHRVGYADPRLLRMARLPPTLFAPRTGGRYAGPRALLNQPPLKLREGRKANGQNIQNAFSLMAANLGQLQQEVL
jgi:hypothetical protein